MIAQLLAVEETIREIDDTRGSAGADVQRTSYMAANSAALTGPAPSSAL